MVDVKSPLKGPENALENENLRCSKLSSSSTAERWRKVEIKRSKGFLAQPINQVGKEVSNISSMFPPIKEPLQVVKSLFPRSVVYEIPYKKRQAELKIQEALRREREALAERVKMKLAEVKNQNQKDEKNMDKVDEEMERLRKEKEPFWYDDSKDRRSNLPSRNTAEYDVNKGLPIERPGEEEPRARMGLDDPGNYIPGQFSGGTGREQTSGQPAQGTGGKKEVQEFAHPPVWHSSGQSGDVVGQDRSLTETERVLQKLEGECHGKKPTKQGEVGVFPLDNMRKKKKDKNELPEWFEYGKTDLKGAECRDFPVNKTRLTTPWGHLRSQEFIKVGRPFRTEAVRWTECNMPTFKPEEEIAAARERLKIKYKDRLRPSVQLSQESYT